MVLYDNKILLEKRSDTGQWGLIGGRLKTDQSLVQGLQREIKEVIQKLELVESHREIIKDYLEQVNF